MSKAKSCLNPEGEKPRIRNRSFESETTIGRANRKPHNPPNQKPANHESETRKPRIINQGIHVGASFNVTDAEPTI